MQAPTQNGVRAYFAVHSTGTTKEIRKYLAEHDIPHKSLHYAIDVLLARGELKAEVSDESKKIFTYTPTELIGKEGLKASTPTKRYVIERVYPTTPEGVLMLQNIFIPQSAALIGMAAGA